MADGVPTGQDAKIGLALRFDVIIDGHDLGGWQQCSGLEVDFSPTTVQEMGENTTQHYLRGRAKYSQITLSRAMVTGNWSHTIGWLRAVQESQLTGSANIILRDAWNAPVANWQLQNVIPVKWQGPTFDSKSSNVAVEKLVLAFEGFADLAEPNAVTRALLIGPSSQTVVLQFNPQSVTRSQKSTREYNPSFGSRGIHSSAGQAAQSQGASGSSPGANYGPVMYWPCTYTLTDVIFDSQYQANPTQASIKDTISLLFYWMERDPSTHQPPPLKFQWGNFLDTLTPILVHLTNSRVNYERLDSDGTPTRAKLTLTLTEINEQEQGTNPTSGGPGGHRTRLIVADESLAAISYQEYGDAGMWTRLAKFNRIDDPTRLAPGRAIQIPTLRILEKV